MDNNDYLELFLSEAAELLISLNHGLIVLEDNPLDNEALDETFRCFHTLKGNAAAMGFSRIEKLAHAMEHVLGQLRTNKIAFTTNVAKHLFRGMDLLETLLSEIQQKTDDTIDEQPLLAELLHLETSENDGEQQADETLNTLEKGSAASGKLKSVRVDLERLDSLMNSVGQLHICKIQLSELSRQREDNALAKAVNEMELTVNQLQTQMMQIRLLPLKYLFNNFPRLVRDDALKEGKEVKISLSGGEIALDRTVLDALNDPLIHILRNAISHGIESPEIRRQLGKPAEGIIRIHAYQEQNKVYVTIEDDGCGLDSEKIRQHLLEKQLMPADVVDTLSAQELLHCIALPDFSLKEDVTERAGRGIGMNVVKTRLEEIGGSFSIHSEVGKGTRFTLHMPVSMAIVPALLVSIHQEICAIPLYNVIETIKIDTRVIRQVNEQNMIPYRDEVLPLYCLRERYNGAVKGNQTAMNEKFCVVVCEMHQKKMGFVVDAFAGQQEIVIKNLPGYMQNIKGYTGATILGNGRVAMILDLSSLVN